MFISFLKAMHTTGWIFRQEQLVLTCRIPQDELWILVATWINVCRFLDMDVPWRTSVSQAKQLRWSCFLSISGLLLTIPSPLLHICQCNLIAVMHIGVLLPPWDSSMTFYCSLFPPHWARHSYNLLQKHTPTAWLNWSFPVINSFSLCSSLQLKKQCSIAKQKVACSVNILCGTSSVKWSSIWKLKI